MPNLTNAGIALLSLTITATTLAPHVAMGQLTTDTAVRKNMTNTPGIHTTANDTGMSAKWIWTGKELAPKNQWTYFRKVVKIDELPPDATLLFSADSNARLSINGHLIRRKVARYHEPEITAEVVNAGPYLKKGENVVEVLHHNWGDIVTFQRTANKHAGLLLASKWINSDASWSWCIAPQFMKHDSQIIGINGGAHRIRYPVIIDGRVEIPTVDDANSWGPAVEVTNGPWLNTPPGKVETPGQREYYVNPLKVLAAGTLETDGDKVTSDVYSIAESMRVARVSASSDAKAEMDKLHLNKSATLKAGVGQSLYVTFDFGQPVHGYPVLMIDSATSGTVIDFGYGEIPHSLHIGEVHAKPDGWINTTGVVGKGYADRYICRGGRQHIEIPEERTARWLALHVHFPVGGEVSLSSAGFIKSQFPVKPIGSFECGDPVMEQIVRLCLIHAEVTMTDSYVDTPGREDGQWIEDAQLRAVIAERWFDDTTLRRLMIRTHTQSQGPDGHTHPFAPSNYPAYPATYDWSVQWVATLYDEYLWSDDKQLVRKYWSNLTRYWDNVLAKVNEVGVWQTNHLLADINVGARLEKPHQSSGIVTPIIIERLAWSADMAEAIGETEVAKRWRDTTDKMKTAFRKFHVVSARGDKPLHVGDRYDPQNAGLERGFSQAGQVPAVYTGLLTPEESRAVLEHTFPAPDGTPPEGISRWNNPTNAYRALKALSHAGLTSRAVAHLKERWSEYLPGHPANPVDARLQGPKGGPLPEYWISRADRKLSEGEVNTAQPNDPTGSHGWQAVPLQWLHESLLGVTIAKPGGGLLNIAPDAGGLPYVAGWTNTPKGPVYVFYDPQQWRVEVILPRVTSAALSPPPEFRGKRMRLKKDDEAIEEFPAEGKEIVGPAHYRLECY